jgi:hypothetical protein
VWSELVVSGSDHGWGSYQCLDQVGGETCDAASPVGDGSFTGDTTNFTQLSPVLDCNDQPVYGRSAWYSYTNPNLFPIQVTASACGSGSQVTLAVASSCANEDAPVACGTPCGIFAEQVTWTMDPLQTTVLRVNAQPLGWGGGYTLGAAYQLVDQHQPAGNQRHVLHVRATATSLLGEQLAIENTDDDCGSPTSLACSIPASGPVSLTLFVPAFGMRMIRVANQQAGNGDFFSLDVTLVYNPGTILDLGNELAPVGGNAPVLSGSGVLCAAADVTLAVNGAVASSIGWLSSACPRSMLPSRGESWCRVPTCS